MGQHFPELGWLNHRVIASVVNTWPHDVTLAFSCVISSYEIAQDSFLRITSSIIMRLTWAGYMAAVVTLADTAALAVVGSRMLNGS